MHMKQGGCVYGASGLEILLVESEDAVLLRAAVLPAHRLEVLPNADTSSQ
jgi:hypothetical protein